MVDQAKIRMTAAEFFQLPETNQPTELIDGELVVSTAPGTKHQRLSRRFCRSLEDLILDGEVFAAPFEVHFDEDNVVQPDILWVSASSRALITDQRVEGPPYLIVEILSPSSIRRDKKEKYQLYQRHGVREYWMVDPVGQYVEVCVWKEGAFGQQGVYGPEDTFESPVLGGKTVDLKPIFGS